MSMRLAHLSDLHFGRTAAQENVLSLRKDLIKTNPELIVITGDITDRGRISEFRRAKDFLDQVDIPFIIVPGNREVCISAFWEWIFPRLAMNRFRVFFGESDRILVKHEESRIAFFGLNSVHFFPSWPGTLTRESRYWLKTKSASLSGYQKVLFLHHPVIPVIRGSSFWAHTFSDAGEVLNICTETGICMILQGHKHRSSVLQVNVPARKAKLIISAAGAPLSSRWDPSYHLLDIKPDEITIAVHEFFHGEFVETAKHRFSSMNASADANTF